MASPINGHHTLHPPETRVGLHSATIAGYALRRALYRGAGEESKRLYAGPLRELIAGKSTFELLPPNVDLSERRESHINSHTQRRHWATQFKKERLALHSAEGQTAYRQAASVITHCNEEFQTLWREMVDDWLGQQWTDPHTRNIAIAPRAFERFQKIMQLAQKIKEAERQWQIEAAKDLMKVGLQYQMKKADPSKEEIERRLAAHKPFAKALRHYEEAAQESLAYSAELMANDSQGYEREKKNRELKVFYALWDLHDVIQSYFQEINHPAAQRVGAPLTFIDRMNAYLIARGPNGMGGLEPFFERTLNLRRITKAAKRGKLGREALDDKALTEWALPLIDVYYSHFRYAKPPADSLLWGGLSDPWRQGAILNAPHTGTIDYAGVIGALHLFGFNPPSILAENIFDWIPVMGDYLKVTTGFFLPRTKKEQKKLIEGGGAYKRIENLTQSGRVVSQFGAGTRALNWPLLSPLADLKSEGALHLPGEFMPSPHMSQMPIEAARRTKAPLIVLTANLHRGGIPEPSLPRTFSGFFSEKQIFHYARPGEEDGFVALAGILPHDSLVTSKDFPTGKYNRHQTTQLNLALVREMEMVWGYLMDAGPFPQETA